MQKKIDFFFNENSHFSNAGILNSRFTMETFGITPLNWSANSEYYQHNYPSYNVEDIVMEDNLEENNIEVNEPMDIVQFDSNVFNSLLNTEYNKSISQCQIPCQASNLEIRGLAQDYERHNSIFPNEIQRTISINQLLTTRKENQTNDQGKSDNFLKVSDTLKLSDFRELRFDFANLIGKDYKLVMKGVHVLPTKLDVIFEHLKTYGFKVNKISFCTKHTQTCVSDKYFRLIKYWLDELEKKWKIQENKILITINVYGYDGVSPGEIIDPKTKKDIVNESDDTGLIHNYHDNVIVVTSDLLRTLNSNIIKLREKKAKLLCFNHDTHEEHSRNNRWAVNKMALEPNAVIDFDSFIIPQVIKVLDPRTLQFKFLFPFNKKFKIVCVHEFHAQVECNCSDYDEYDYDDNNDYDDDNQYNNYNNNYNYNKYNNRCNTPNRYNSLKRYNTPERFNNQNRYCS